MCRGFVVGWSARCRRTGDRFAFRQQVTSRRRLGEDTLSQSVVLGRSIEGSLWFDCCEEDLGKGEPRMGRLDSSQGRQPLDKQPPTRTESQRGDGKLTPPSYFFMNHHIVLSTKDRRPLITPDLAHRLYPYQGGLARERECVLRAIGGIPDHVHLLLSVSPRVVVSDVPRDIISISSGWVKDVICSDFA
ncbi:MAG: hypothetical protein CME19_11200 [Gemmatimonadetes bacterium]|nr:hypothetical protein [Gemmatimonadota bacterium]